MSEDLPSNEMFPDALFELSESDMFKAIRDRVAYLLDKNPELLMSYLYRLDVLEVKINAVLSPNAVVAPVEGLARLILNRQKERIATKQKYKSDPPIPGWEF
ncbi:MAG: hypothetical protein ACJA1A_000669 [Saprospiraceae bacterium]|jgi:hypothetical protein|tara:strand:+ start:1192 stop:1497 length:306 start_codon:yes stop_codon:yes gene_type:complete